MFVSALAVLTSGRIQSVHPLTFFRLLYCTSWFYTDVKKNPLAIFVSTALAITIPTVVSSTKVSVQQLQEEVLPRLCSAKE